MKGSCNQDELSEPFLQQWNNEAQKLGGAFGCLVVSISFQHHMSGRRSCSSIHGRSAAGLAAVELTLKTQQSVRKIIRCVS